MFLSHIPWIGDYLGSFPPIAGRVYRVVTYCEGLTKKRLERGSIKKDLYHYLVCISHPTLLCSKELAVFVHCQFEMTDH